jgi:hypothetical protein
MPDTNWVIDNFCIVQELGGNIETEDGLLLSLQEYDNVNWVIDTGTGSG